MYLTESDTIDQVLFMVVGTWPALSRLPAKGGSWSPADDSR